MPIDIIILSSKKNETLYSIGLTDDLFVDQLSGVAILKVYKNALGEKEALLSTSVEPESFIETRHTRVSWESVIRETIILANDLGAGFIATDTLRNPIWFMKILVKCGLKKGTGPYYYADLGPPDELEYKGK